jgi:uncharacterized protein
MGETGDSRHFRFADEPLPDTELDLKMTAKGEVTIVRLNEGLQVEGRVAVVLPLECHRCLRMYDQPLSAAFSGYFSETPGEDEYVIDQASIDLAPLMTQEILLESPVKQLCRLDCLGICLVCGEVQEKQHQHA